MDTVYRIYTEATEVIRIMNYVGEYYDGFTTFVGTGYWRGRRETCLVIEIICHGHSEDRVKVLKIASWLKSTFNQESVAITRTQAMVFFVGKSL